MPDEMGGFRPEEEGFFEVGGDVLVLNDPTIIDGEVSFKGLKVREALELREAIEALEALEALKLDWDSEAPEFAGVMASQLMKRFFSTRFVNNAILATYDSYLDEVEVLTERREGGELPSLGFKIATWRLRLEYCGLIGQVAWQIVPAPIRRFYEFVNSTITG